MNSMRIAATTGTAIEGAMPYRPVYTMAAAMRIAQPAWQAMRKLRVLACIVIVGSLAFAEDPPAGLARLVAHRESETEAERNQYAYRQTVKVTELNDHGSQAGEYREIRDIIFSPTKERSEAMVGPAFKNLKNLILTEEDFKDIRDIQPFVLVEDFLPIYETKFRGEEKMDGVDCWVLQVRPKQILAGQRLFDGMIWASKKDYSVIRSEGQAVPQIRTTKSENLFPKFTTVRKQVNGFWFPAATTADDTLFFRTGAQRIRMSIRFENYQKFGAETTITFGEKKP
jgi:hypothetical protein